jgi:hypothetical protein
MSDSSKVIVREAVTSDAESVARVHVDSWRETYSGVLDDRFFSEDAFTRRLRFWSRSLSLWPRPGRMSVAIQDEKIIGFANAGAAAGPDAEHGSPFTSLLPPTAAAPARPFTTQWWATSRRNFGYSAATPELSRFTHATDSPSTESSRRTRQIPTSLSSAWCADA